MSDSGKLYRGYTLISGGGGGGDVTVDDKMSTTSTNPVQNKVITKALNDQKIEIEEITEAEVDDIFDSVFT